MITAGVIGPLMALPQIFKIFIGKTAEGISLATFSMFALLNIPWIVYGIVHKEKVIVITYVLWLIVNSIIVAGVLIY